MCYLSAKSHLKNLSFILTEGVRVRGVLIAPLDTSLAQRSQHAPPWAQQVRIVYGTQLVLIANDGEVTLGTRYATQITDPTRRI